MAPYSCLELFAYDCFVFELELLAEGPQMRYRDCLMHGRPKVVVVADVDERDADAFFANMPSDDFSGRCLAVRRHAVVGQICNEQL